MIQFLFESYFIQSAISSKRQTTVGNTCRQIDAFEAMMMREDCEKGFRLFDFQSETPHVVSYSINEDENSAILRRLHHILKLLIRRVWRFEPGRNRRRRFQEEW